MFGGHQQAGLRPGTEPVALAVGMATALEIWQRTGRACPAVDAAPRPFRAGLRAGLAEL